MNTETKTCGCGLETEVEIDDPEHIEWRCRCGRTNQEFVAYIVSHAWPSVNSGIKRRASTHNRFARVSRILTDNDYYGSDPLGLFS